MPNRTAISPIQPFQAGSGRTPLSANAINELVRALNALLMLQGEQGIQVHRAESHFTIAIDEEYIKSLVGEVEPGTGTLNWKGVWDVDTTYATGDIVIRHTPELMSESKTGTFVSKANNNTGNAPPAYPLTSNTHWEVLAAGSWGRLRVEDTATAANGSFDALGGRIVAELDNNDPPTTLDLNRGVAIPNDIKGMVLSPFVVKGCDLDTGDIIELALIGCVIPEEE